MRPGAHANWYRERLAGARVLDVGGGEASARGWRAARRHSWRPLALPGALVAAALCTVGGALLGAGSSSVQVSRDSSRYRIAGATLRSVSAHLYVGDGVLVVSATDAERSAASAVVGGRAWVGVCVVTASGLHETCRLSTLGIAVAATDVWSQGAWHRQYSDGVAVLITASPGVPVPFPVGR